ncbi:glycosyltransferase family 90 protein [Amanita thiersii Skay4041]|uniref:Glycosyltransferase family 90 protein n=1 Tax=Amanita thiersii Skay4041 TaxID=703135 RepID=A0A2A9NBC3_9AGAR|nr:glycosyltransferase family 90 protein [Amanita thiersii Skay4041]
MEEVDKQAPAVPNKSKSRLQQQRRGWRPNLNFKNFARATDVERAVAHALPHPGNATHSMRSAGKRRSQALLSFLNRHSGSIFIFVVVIVFLRAGFYAGQNRPESSSHHVLNKDDTNWFAKPGSLLTPSDSSTKQRAAMQHPIPKLMEDAEAQYKEKLRSQSKTLKAAVAEYKRRYNRDPPKGFDQWFKFAKQNNVKMVDEYDGMVSDLEPFWELPSRELRRRSRQVAQLPSIDLVRITNGVPKAMKVVKDGFDDSEANARAHGFVSMMTRFAKRLPDMEFPINAKAEGRVLVPWEHRKYPNMTQQDSSGGIETILGNSFEYDWGGNGNVWEAWRRTCDPSSPARRLFASLRNSFAVRSNNYLAEPNSLPGSDFRFMKGTSAKFDFCEHPHAHYTQGHFFSDWRTIPALYPVFSPAKAKGYSDIRVPSHYYYGSTPAYTYGWDRVNLELKDVDQMEVPWEDKIDKIFWRGATTGGGSHPPGFTPQYQRHRFLRMASDKSDTNRSITYTVPSTNPPNFVTTQVSMGKLNEEIMDAAFTKAMAPETYPGGLEALEAAHRFGDAVPLGRHWSYRYLVDLDGMSYSGRFMAFLASDSVPIKSTVYEEFYSDWIQPWVQFIPLSSSYKEVYNIYAYFTGPTKATLEAANSSLASTPIERRRSVEGDKRLRRIARAGKEWKRTIGRKVDMEVYVYRLCLEWARLWADDREAMSFRL